MSQNEIEETIQDIAESHPEYSIESFTADFKSMIGRDSTFAEKRAFLKAVANTKSKLNETSTSQASFHLPSKVINGYAFAEVLGKGSFGEVYKAKKKGAEYAIKQVDESYLSGDLEQSFADSISARLNSKFIVRYFDKFRGPGGELYVVMELCQKGDLRSVINRLREMHAILQTPRVAKILIQLLLALYALHANHLIHRDLKPENIFSDDADNVKVGDFGCAKELDTTSMKANTVVGTPLYESPQVIRGEEYDASADMWALGVLLYELCTLERPFQHANRFKLQELIFAGKYTPLPVGRYPAEISKIIDSLLNVDPNKRPTALVLLQDPFIQMFAAELNLLTYFPPSAMSSKAAVVATSIKGKADKEEAENAAVTMSAKKGKKNIVIGDVETLDESTINPVIIDVFKQCGIKKSDVLADKEVLEYLQEISSVKEHPLPPEKLQKVHEMVDRLMKKKEARQQERQEKRGGLPGQGPPVRGPPVPPVRGVQGPPVRGPPVLPVPKPHVWEAPQPPPRMHGTGGTFPPLPSCGSSNDDL